MITLLHLSDLHFTTESADTQFDRDLKIRAAILNDLGRDGRSNFDAILVTGDISYHGRTDELNRAKAWLEEIRKATNSTPEAIFVVPGNHDVNQAKVPEDSSLWDLHQGLRKRMAPEDREHSLSKKLLDPALDFLIAMSEYRSFAAEYGCPTNPKDLAWVQVLDDKRALDDGTHVRFHGLNTALISDGEDVKANLLLGACQFHRFDANPDYINIVLCHHPHTWLLDGDQANDFLRNQAHVVLSGHDHTSRCYMEGGSLRVFAGAIHPNRREPNCDPSYNVVRLSINSTGKRELVVAVETRVWRDRDKVFGPLPVSGGANIEEVRFQLASRKNIQANEAKDSTSMKNTISSTSEKPVESSPPNDALLAARRKLIVHFFRLGIIDRYKVVIEAGVWDESDDALEGQERWARVFERAEKASKFGALWVAVAKKDETLMGQSNPFETGR